MSSPAPYAAYNLYYGLADRTGVNRPAFGHLPAAEQSMHREGVRRTLDKMRVRFAGVHAVESESLRPTPDVNSDAFDRSARGPEVEVCQHLAATLADTAREVEGEQARERAAGPLPGRDERELLVTFTRFDGTLVREQWGQREAARQHYLLESATHRPHGAPFGAQQYDEKAELMALAAVLPTAVVFHAGAARRRAIEAANAPEPTVNHEGRECVVRASFEAENGGATLRLLDRVSGEAVGLVTSHGFNLDNSMLLRESARKHGPALIFVMGDTGGGGLPHELVLAGLCRRAEREALDPDAVPVNLALLEITDEALLTRWEQVRAVAATGVPTVTFRGEIGEVRVNRFSSGIAPVLELCRPDTGVAFSYVGTAEGERDTDTSLRFKIHAGNAGLRENLVASGVFAEVPAEAQPDHRAGETRLEILHPALLAEWQGAIYEHQNPHNRVGETEEEEEAPQASLS